MFTSEDGGPIYSSSRSVQWPVLQVYATFARLRLHVKACLQRLTSGAGRPPLGWPREWPHGHRLRVDAPDCFWRSVILVLSPNSIFLGRAVRGRLGGLTPQPVDPPFHRRCKSRHEIAPWLGITDVFSSRHRLVSPFWLMPMPSGSTD